MIVADLIAILQQMPLDAEIYSGQEEYHKEADGLPVFGLFDFEPVHYAKIRSCRGQLPTSNSVKENVVVLEYE